MKNTYKDLEFQVIPFRAEDIIATSSEGCEGQNMGDAGPNETQTGC